jgi:hypothetical protein
VCQRREIIGEGIVAETPIPLPLPLQRWVDTLITALKLNDAGATARKKAGVSLGTCPGCKQWTLDGRINHLPNCHAETWNSIKENQRQLPSPRQREQLKVSEAIATNRKKTTLGPPITAPAPKKSKSHRQPTWPPIIPGGAVETNKRKF